MKRPKQHRRIIISLLVSMGLHLLGIWLVHILVPPEVEQKIFKVRIPAYIPKPLKRFKHQPFVLVSRELLERLQSAEEPQVLEFELGEEIESVLPEMEPPILEGEISIREIGKKGKWKGEKDTLETSLGFIEQVTELPLVDWVVLDAHRRHYTVAVIDPETKKLKRAYLHLPVYMNSPISGYHGGKEITEILRILVVLA